jgi:hypothetical protein
MSKRFQRGNILMQPIIINHPVIERDHSEISPKDPDRKKDIDLGHERGEDHTLEIEKGRIQRITRRAIIKRKEDNNQVQTMIEDQVCIIKQVTIVIRLKNKKVQLKSNPAAVAQSTKVIIQTNHRHLHPHRL